MAQITQFFFPPQYWQQFEDLTAAVFPHVFGDPTPTKIGRPGQAQNGVDVHGTRTATGESVGIQCKRMDEFDENNQPVPGGPITKRILLDEYDKACSFCPTLNTWILATTAKRDGTTQAIQRELDEKSRSRGGFSVKLWFWDDYVTYLNCYDDLVAFYYPSVMKLNAPIDQDRAILEVFSLAISRPAFHTSFQRENAEEFEQALKDSQTAISTGELVSRETRHVIRKAVGGWRSLDNPKWRDASKGIYDKLRDLRGMIRDGLNEGSIVRFGKYGVRVPDHKTEMKLSDLRQSCIHEMNQVLSEAGMPTI